VARRDPKRVEQVTNPKSAEALDESRVDIAALRGVMGLAKEGTQPSCQRILPGSDPFLCPEIRPWSVSHTIKATNQCWRDPENAALRGVYFSRRSSESSSDAIAGASLPGSCVVLVRPL
jgi:hypothetical protein